MFQFDFTLDPNHIEALITNVWRSHCPVSISIMRTSRSLSKNDAHFKKQFNKKQLVEEARVNIPKDLSHDTRLGLCDSI